MMVWQLRQEIDEPTGSVIVLRFRTVPALAGIVAEGLCESIGIYSVWAVPGPAGQAA